MKENIHPIATVTSTSGLEGDVRLRPLSRYFEEYIEEKGLRLGNTSSQSQIIQLELITGIGKKRRFKFQGVNNLSDFLNNNKPVCDFVYEQIKELLVES